MLRSLLVANRGEIALRVIRACREMGIRSVAVYSEPDRLSPHVAAADEAHLLGPAAASESYLHIGRILEAARRAGVEAVHPGYGFLAERAPFARAVEEAGLTFVGPTPETIAAMGDKTEARQRMRDAGVPVVPGAVAASRDPEDAVEAAREIGFPVLLKAVAGGGGKGMRVVDEAEALPRAFEGATREAEAAFGDGSVYLEKYLDAPRHVEIQVMGDGRGRLIHLGERECSIQRRHQKLVEEAPSSVLSRDERERMGETAVQAARAVEYRGAGTVEFLYQDGDFYFLEMNTRLQVEHPVTELVTGTDLVEWQIRIASGEALELAQEDVRMKGHALECRITSEDPARGFLPSAGRIDHLEVPGGSGVRWDGGVTEGFEVGLHYDPLMGKLVVHASTRDGAIQRMARVLDELVIRGVETSAPFHRRLMQEPDFRRGRLSIRFLDDHPHLTDAAPPEKDLRAAAIAVALLEESRRRQRAPRIADGSGEGISPWKAASLPGRTHRDRGRR